MIISDMNAQDHSKIDLNGAVGLDDWGVIRASGADARSFLHGQLTQDVTGLAPGQARLAGFCSVKGRLSASFVIWCEPDGDTLLACSKDLLAATLKRLSMFVMRAKCKLTDASDEVPLLGLAGSLVPDLAPWQTAAVDGRLLIRLPDAVGVARALLAGPGPLPKHALQLEDWRWLEVQSGIARIDAATVDEFVPQMINFELVGGVNFKKGCFPGQEIVARSQYRGSIKRRAYIVTSDVGLRSGQDVFSAADPSQPAGKVVLAGTHAGRHAALVELKIAAVSEALHAGQPDGPMLTPGALPYPLPTEAE